MTPPATTAINGDNDSANSLMLVPFDCFNSPPPNCVSALNEDGNYLHQHPTSMLAIADTGDGSMTQSGDLSVSVYTPEAPSETRPPFTHRLAAAFISMWVRLLLSLTMKFRRIVRGLCYVRDNPIPFGRDTYKTIRKVMGTPGKEQLEELLTIFFQRLDRRLRTVALEEEGSFWSACWLLLRLIALTDVHYCIGQELMDLPYVHIKCSDFGCYAEGTLIRFPLLFQTLYVARRVVYRDFLFKFGTMVLKAFLLVLPTSMLDRAERENTFQFIEYTSQLCRKLLPVLPWLIFFTDGYTLRSVPAQILTPLLIEAYFYFKFTLEIKKNLLHVWRIVMKPFLAPRGGNSGTEVPCNALVLVEDKSRQEACPICYETIVNPKMLHCSHIYCKKCIDTWFGQLRMMSVKTTCPLCTVTVIEDVDYKDGSTAGWIVGF